MAPSVANATSTTRTRVFRKRTSCRADQITHYRCYPFACAGLARIVNGSSIFWILIAKPNASLTAIIGGAMQTVEITNPKEARRCRYAQYRGEQARLMLNGAPVTGMIRAVMEDRSSIPNRWTVTLISKKGIAA
jgi:hypothetical protein